MAAFRVIFSYHGYACDACSLGCRPHEMGTVLSAAVVQCPFSAVRRLAIIPVLAVPGIDDD